MTDPTSDQPEPDAPANPMDVPTPFIEATADMMADAPDLPEPDQTPVAVEEGQS